MKESPEQEASPDVLAGEARSRAKRRWHDVLTSLLHRGASRENLRRAAMPRHLLHDHIADLATIETLEGWHVIERKDVRDGIDNTLKLEVLDELHAETAPEEAA